MATSSAVATDVLTDVVRERARAEAREILAMLNYRDAEIARTEPVQPPLRRQVERSAIPLTIGESMALSEGQVQLRLSAADTVRHRAPVTWTAFGAGLIDFVRVRDIAHAIDKLQRPESVRRLDQRVIGYADDHTAAELRAWLRRFIQRVEADLAVERAEAEREKRHVSTSHTEDSMGWLNAYLPSHELAALEARLHQEARRPAAEGDERTAAQREADLLVAWCTASHAATSAGDVNVAVTIDADVLAGAHAGFAESSDGRWAVPASWIVGMALTGNAFWHRIVLDPIKDDVLSHEYLGRFAPELLAVALAFRDGVCQAPGCMVPAKRCDIDHRVPYPEGPTRADNLGALCRRHHTFKGHGILRWSTHPPGPAERPPPLVVEIYPHSVDMAYAA